MTDHVFPNKSRQLATNALVNCVRIITIPGVSGDRQQHENP